MSQMPAGELLDTVRSKRAAIVLGAFMIAEAALTIALWPVFPVVLAALALQAISGGFLGPCRMRKRYAAPILITSSTPAVSGFARAG